jgi:two-component system OmpR family response regulator
MPAESKNMTHAASEDLIDLLLVEDDARLAALTAEYLELHHLVVTRVADGAAAAAAIAAHHYDLVVLDLALPGKSGIEVLTELRRYSDVPVIIVTARGEEADRVLGLELGADDYLAKPFASRELLARIHAQVRRYRGRLGAPRDVVTVGALRLDPGARQATLEGRPLDLTGYELDLLLALARSAGRVLSRDQLMQLAAGSASEAFDRSIDVHISRLRKKLGNPEWIATVRGAGYVLRAGGKS